ncbi:(R)-mandelonitrile lyase [Streptosporangium saharense]|uniref:Quercetin dioxygenase-like cupin family protein n=1 Tax=Streptosporangium saharense TaxID=1706840 RepID=A0A7W7VK93_9ACTN|nr:cupin domain-containing protein [Streptosporangium saharense]MBB4913456.1 quercetin dioxygenase-like cupin family protein [Streptosporangium saharense]
MELLRQPPATKGPAEWFTGDVWFDVIHRGEEPSRSRANLVRFAPGARTAWHSHGLGQSLLIVAGVALVQARGDRLIEAHPGDVIWTPPGEEHWHGAAPGYFMSHLALWEGDDTTWLEHVTETDYTATPQTTRR